MELHQGEEATVAVIRYEGTNARGEPSSPRVDLLAVGQLIDRAAVKLEMQAHQLKAALQLTRIDPEARGLVNDLVAALRAIRSLRCRRKRRLRWSRERD
jgi:hypothetical protein